MPEEFETVEKAVSDDIVDIINSIDEIDEPVGHDDMSIFEDLKVETPFVEEPKTMSYSVNREDVAHGNVGVNISEQSANIGDEYTVIGSSTSIKGDLSVDGNMELSGSIKGNLIVSGSLILKGKVDGSVQCGETVVKSGAKIDGDVIVENDAKVESGAEVNGNVAGHSVEVNGVVGGVTAETVILNPAAVVEGNISAISFRAKAGCTIKGDIEIN